MTESTNEQLDPNTIARLVVLVVIPHYWGKGSTLREAWKSVSIAASGSVSELKRGPYRVYVMPETGETRAYIDGIGTLHYANVEAIEALCIEEKTVL